MRYVRCAAITLTAAALVAAAAVAAFVWSGLYDVAATNAHGGFSYWLLHTTALRSISRHAKDIKVPSLDRPGMIERGLHLFRQDCVQCHGAPGEPPDDFAKAWKAAGGQGDWGVPKTWQQVQAATKFLKGKKVGGKDVYGYLDAPKGWGGFGFYFLESRATAYAKHPNDKAWLFDVDTMKPRVNNPAWVRAIQDVIDALPSEPADQLNADPGTTGFQQFLAGTGSMLAWWGDIGEVAQTSDTSVVGDKIAFDILPGSDDVYNHKTSAWEKLPTGPNYAPNMAYLGWGVYVMARVDSDKLKHKAAWSAAAHLGGKDISLWTVMYPSGFQPHRQSHFNIPEWTAAGYDKAYITSYLNSLSNSYNHPNAAIEPRIPGIFQYYSVAEDELAKVFAGKLTAQAGADNIAAAWEKITDKVGREKQIALYKASLGL